MKKIIKIFKAKIVNALFKRKNIKRFIPIEKMFLGKKIFIHDIASFELCNNELFRQEMYKFEVNTSKPYVIDCGANIGMSIIYFKELYPDAEIIAFEADDYIFGFLEKNMASYGYENVELHNKAVWNCEDILSFVAEGGAGGRLEEVREFDVYKNVSCTSLKKYLVGRKVDFLKIDIEGAEYEVIKDCEKELLNVENLFIEYHSMKDKKQNLHRILEIVQKSGFKYHIKEAYTSKYPFIERKLNFGMDLQLNIFCYRIES